MPYREIASRNSFGLKPPLEKPNSPPVVAPLPKIRLAGITTILGRKIAILSISRDGSAARQCLVFAEGERQDEIEVTEIDEKAGVVKVLNRGEEQTLDFDHTDDKTSIVPPVCFTPTGVSSPPNPDSLSPEEQTILIEAQRIKAIQDGDPIAKLLPLTDFTSEIMADY